MRAVIYGRVSTEEQYRSGFSLSEQLKACRERARTLPPMADEPLQLSEFTDSVSGELLERPGLQAALDLVRRRQVDWFICLDPDRLARRLMHQLLVTDEIERSGCRLEFVQHDYQESPEGRLFYQLRGAIAEFEKAKILERTSRGQRGKVAAGGLPHAIRMYGYRFVKGAGKQAPARMVLLPDPHEARWVRQIFRWAAEEAIGPYSIARRLNQLGVPTKTGRGLWQHTQVRRILSHPTYATGLLALGKRDHRGIAVARRLTATQRRAKGIALTARPKPRSQWQHVTVEPLIAEPLWQAARASLERRAGARSTAGQDQSRPLSGLGRCGLCGGPLYYLNGNRIVCAARYGRHWRNQSRCPADSDCRLPAKPRAAVEAAVWEQVKGWLLEPDRLQAGLRSLVAEAGALQPEAPGAAEGETIALEVKLREAERERLGLLFARGLWPGEKALPAIDQVNRQIEALAARQAALAAQPAPPRTSGEPELRIAALTPGELTRAATEALARLTETQKARLIRLAVHRYELLPSERGEAPSVRLFPAGQPPAAGESR